MKSPRLVLLAALAIGCSSVAPATSSRGPHFVGAATNGTSGYELRTLYQGQAATGYQVTFTKGKWLVSALSRGGICWVKQHPPSDDPGTIPTTPVPSVGTMVTGWVRLGDGESITFGIDPGTTESEGNPPISKAIELIYFLDVWFETAGDLVAIAH